MRFPKLKISSIDDQMLRLLNLRVLDLSFNRVKTLQNVPPELEELYLNSNCITEIKGPVNRSLLHLGLGYNQIKLEHLSDIAKFYPNLFSLNLSFNEIEELDKTTAELKTLTNLKVLKLMGNPVALQPDYRKYTLENLSDVQFLDETAIVKDVGSKKQKPEEEIEKTAHRDDCFIDLAFTVAGDLEGISIDDELWKNEEKPFEELEEN